MMILNTLEEKLVHYYETFQVIYFLIAGAIGGGAMFFFNFYSDGRCPPHAMFTIINPRIVWPSAFDIHSLQV